MLFLYCAALQWCLQGLPKYGELRWSFHWMSTPGPTALLEQFFHLFCWSHVPWPRWTFVGCQCVAISNLLLFSANIVIWRRPVVSLHISHMIKFLAFWGICAAESPLNKFWGSLGYSWLRQLQIGPLIGEAFLNWPFLHSHAFSIISSLYPNCSPPFTVHCFTCFVEETKLTFQTPYLRLLCLFPVLTSSGERYFTSHVMRRNLLGVLIMIEPLLICGPTKDLSLQLCHMV